MCGGFGCTTRSARKYSTSADAIPYASIAATTGKAHLPFRLRSHTACAATNAAANPAAAPNTRLARDSSSGVAHDGQVSSSPRVSTRMRGNFCKTKRACAIPHGSSLPFCPGLYRAKSASTASPARRPLAIAPWIDALSRWSPQTYTPGRTRTGRCGGSSAPGNC